MTHWSTATVALKAVRTTVWNVLYGTYCVPSMLALFNFRMLRALRYPPRFFELAKKKGVTPAQLALAWVLARGPDVVPIPGTKSVARMEENAGAAAISLTAEECAEIEAAVPKAVGDRYEGMQGTFNARA